MQAVTNNDDVSNHHPIQELPNEMFISILSFLSPSSIARSSATSRFWRTSIFSSPKLHQEIDLTKLNGDEDSLSIVYHFQRLSFLSLNRLTKVSIDISPFFKVWMANETDKKDQRFQALDILLTILQQSQKTLREITWVADGEIYTFELYEHDLLLFLLQLLRHLRIFTSLEFIWLEGPIYLSLSAGNSSPTMVAVRNNDYYFEAEFPYPNTKVLADLMQEVKEMSGSSLTEFMPQPHRYEEWDEEESSRILECLLDCSLLEKLDASWFSPVHERELWRLATSLEHLTFLVFHFIGDEEFQDEDVETLQVPHEVGMLVSNLQELELTVLRVKVDWISIANWVGESLERLILEVDSETIRGLLPPNFNKSIITNSRDSLEEIYIRNQTEGITQVDLSTIPKLCFPNLKKLHLEDVDASIFQCFSMSEVPKLQDLVIIGSDPLIIGQSFDCLMQILQRSGSEIIKLKISIKDIGGFECSPPDFNFRSLEILQIGEDEADKTELPGGLLTSQYPNLTDLKLVGLDDEEVKEISSKLKAEGKAPKLPV